MYFSSFPRITYKGSDTINLLARVQLIKPVLGDPTSFYPYQVEAEDRIENVAFNYYDDCNYFWLIALANNIIDPYHDWAISPSKLDELIAMEYGSIAAAQQNIIHYRTRYNSEEKITVASYNALPWNEQKYWVPLDDNFYGLNEDRLYSNTNVIMRLLVTTKTVFTDGEYLSQNGATAACITTDGGVMIQHVSGAFTTGSITTSTGTTTITGIETIAESIPGTELSYWEPVTMYQHLHEMNTDKQTILLLSNRYARQSADQLKKMFQE